MADRASETAGADGWVLVPRQPTEVMLRAGWKAIQHIQVGQAEASWSAMLAACPASPQASPTAEGVRPSDPDAVVAKVEAFLARHGGFRGYAEHVRTGTTTGWSQLRSTIWLAVHALAPSGESSGAVGDVLQRAVANAAVRLFGTDAIGQRESAAYMEGRMDALMACLAALTPESTAAAQGEPYTSAAVEGETPADVTQRAGEPVEFHPKWGQVADNAALGIETHFFEPVSRTAGVEVMLREVMRTAQGIASGPDGQGRMKVVVMGLEPGAEFELHSLLSAALSASQAENG